MLTTDKEYLVSCNFIPFFINRNQTISITIESNADIGTNVQNLLC